MSATDFCVLVLNHGPCARTVQYVNAIVARTCAPVIVVDTDSPHGTCDRLREQLAGKAAVEVVKLPDNWGYARGNNHGVRHIESEHPQIRFVLISNNDVLLSDQFAPFVREAIGMMTGDRRILCVGPKIVDCKGKMQTPILGGSRLWLLFYYAFYPLSYAVEKTIRNTWFRMRNTPQRVFSLPGSFWIFNTANLSAIDLFDPRTFLYAEEDIVGLRAQAHGLDIVYHPAFRFVHDHRHTVDKSLDQRTYYQILYRSFLVYLSYFGGGLFSAVMKRFGRSRYRLAECMKTMAISCRRAWQALQLFQTGLDRGKRQSEA